MPNLIIQYVNVKTFCGIVKNV